MVGPRFPSFVEASWLADVEFDKFIGLDQDHITIADRIYLDLDRKLHKTLSIADYNSSDFYKISRKLDRK